EGRIGTTETMIVCKRVIYSGQVQGVGFRYTTRQLAEGFGVCGYVRNLRNGDVEVVAEGEQGEVDGLLAAMRQRMAAYIEDEAVQEQPVQGLPGFVVRT